MYTYSCFVLDKIRLDTCLQGNMDKDCRKMESLTNLDFTHFCSFYEIVVASWIWVVFIEYFKSTGISPKMGWQNDNFLPSRWPWDIKKRKNVEITIVCSE